jgi:hypothetical protein
VIVVLSATGGACGPAALTPAEQKEIDRTAATIAECEAAGRACKAGGGAHCFRASYRACMTDGGL